MTRGELPFNVEDAFDGDDRELFMVEPPPYRPPLVGLIVLGFAGWGIIDAVWLVCEAVAHVF